MYYNFFIHSSVDGHPGCFRVLAIVNNAAMNNGIRVSFSILVSSGYMPRSGIAEETKIEKDTRIPLFIAALFTIARTWKQPRCPSTDE